MTPTLRTGSNTPNDCQIASYRPAWRISSSMMVSAARSRSQRPPPPDAWRELARTLPHHESRRDREVVAAARHGYQTTVPVRPVGCHVLVA